MKRNYTKKSYLKRGKMKRGGNKAIQKLRGNRREKKRKGYLGFMYLKKEYDRANKEAL